MGPVSMHDMRSAACQAARGRGGPPALHVPAKALIADRALV